MTLTSEALGSIVWAKGEIVHTLRTAAASTVVSYVASAYGRSTVLTLIDLMGEYKTWDELIPAVFGVPKEDFVTGWRTYLTEMNQ